MERYALFLLVLWVVLLYIPSISCDFALDDAFLIVRNRYFANGHIDWWGIISEDLWSGEEHRDGISSFYRPIFLCTIAFDFLLVGLHPLWFHIHNLIWHVLCIFVYWKLLHLLDLNKTQIIVAVACFGLHPINSEVVVWISARNDSIATCFACCAICFAFKNYALVFLLSLCAYFSKESTLLLPFFIYQCLQGHQKQKSSTIASCLAIIPWFLIRYFLNIPTQLPDAHHLELFLTTLPTTIVHVVGILIFPIELSAVRPLAWYHLHPSAGFGCILIVALYIASTKRSYFWMGILCYIPVLLPISLNGIYGDRYLYLPLIWFSLWISQFYRYHRSLSIFGIMFLSFSYRISERIPDWKNDLFVWNSEVVHSDSSYAKASLAHILYNEGHYDTALLYYKDAFDDDIPYLDGCAIYLSLLLKRQSPQMVIDEYHWLLDRGCEKDGLLDGVVSLAYVANRDLEGAETIVRHMDVDPSKRSDITRSVLAIRKEDWSVVCSLQNTWSDPLQFSQQLEVMLNMIEWTDAEGNSMNQALMIDRCKK